MVAGEERKKERKRRTTRWPSLT